MKPPKLETALGILLAGVLVIIILGAIVVSQLSREVWQQQAATSNHMLEQTTSIASEGNGILEDLGELTLPGCSAAMLRKMRETLFFSNHLRDISYAENGTVLCSAVRGKLEKPFTKPEPDYTSNAGFKVWARANVTLFEQSMTATVAEKGNFGAIYDDSVLNNLFPSPYEWQLVYQQNGITKPVLGYNGIFRGHTVDSTRSVDLRNHYYSECSRDYPYCVAVQVSNLALMQRYPGLVFLLSGACVLAGLATALLLSLALKTHSSPRNRVRRGIGNGNVYPLYQPIIEMKNGEVTGCEVLARFKDNQGPMFPDQFIPLVAEMGLTWAFTLSMIRQAVDTLENDPSIPDGFWVSINLFPCDITSGQVRDLANVSALKGSRLQLNFEITEDQQLDTHAAQKNLHWLREQGYGLAVDDFGTGYSNLSHIRELRCDTLKIDRSFITDIEEGGVRAAIVPIMIRLAEELELKVIAEGVENEAQRDIVMDLGITRAQGWLYGKPMAKSELVMAPAMPIVRPDQT